LSGGYDPWEVLLVRPDRAAPPLDLDLEQDLVVYRPDPLVRCSFICELVACLDQQRVI